MSAISRIVKCVLFVIILVVSIQFAPFANDVTFTEFRVQSSNKYQSDDRSLNNAERLFEGFIRGPECFTIYKNKLYMSAHGGWVYRLDEDQIVKVVKTGKDCANHWWEEAHCGRPLGIKFDSQGYLYIADTYYGIFRANMTSGVFGSELEQLVSMDKPIEGKAPMLPNSLDISKNGLLYWTDSSTTHKLHDGSFAVLADGNGRVLKLNLTSGENTVLMESMAFSNGLVLSKDESFFAVAETGRSRVHKYHLKGPKAGSFEVFLDGLPGFPDNLHLNTDGHIVVSLMNPFEPGKNSMDILGQWPSIRKFIYKTLGLLDMSFAYLNNVYPHYLFALLHHWVGHLELANFILSKEVKVLVVNDQGEVKQILNAVDGKVFHISDLIAYKGFYYLGSPYNNYLGRVKI